jgi:hypothetical protein
MFFGVGERKAAAGLFDALAAARLPAELAAGLPALAAKFS